MRLGVKHVHLGVFYPTVVSMFLLSARYEPHVLILRIGRF